MSATDEARDQADTELHRAIEALTCDDDHLAALRYAERAVAWLRALEQQYRAESHLKENQQ